MRPTNMTGEKSDVQTSKKMQITFPKAANTINMKPFLPKNMTLCGYSKIFLIGLNNSRKPLLLIVRFVKYSINFTILCSMLKCRFMHIKPEN